MLIKPHPGELIYSMLGRYNDLLRPANALTPSVVFFATKQQSSFTDLPTHFNRLGVRLGLNDEGNTGELIRNHTTLPYYARFISKARLSKIVDRMKGETGPPVHNMLGRSASAVTYPTFLRYCSVCAEADREKYGQAYWHREHQLPFVTVCHEHQTALIDSDIKRHRSYGFISLDSVIDRVKHHQVDAINTAHIGHLENIARDTKWLLENWDGGIDITLTQSLERSILMEGHSRRLGKRLIVDHEKLRSGIISHFPIDFLISAGFAISDERADDWLSRLVLDGRSQRPSHPLFHVLLMDYLGVSARELYNPPIPMPVIPFVNQVKRRDRKPVLRLIDWVKRDAEVFDQLRSAHEQIISSEGKPRRVTLYSLTQLTGHRDQIRNNLQLLPLSKSFIDTVAETPRTFAERRFKWFVDQCISQGKLPSQSVLRLYAGKFHSDLPVDSALRYIRESILYKKAAAPTICAQEPYQSQNDNVLRNVTRPNP